MVVYTSICLNYLPKALTLGKSLKKNNKKIKFVIILLERELSNEYKDLMKGIVDDVILAKNLVKDDFDKFIFKHSIVEAATSVKGKALVYLLEKYDDKVVYIDPDIKVYNKLDKLEKMLEEKDVILTPHLTIPETEQQNIDNNELCALRHGVYNLGFVAVKKGSEGLKFAKWWRDRLNLYCYDDIPAGIFTDQRWCDLAPAYFDVMILKDPGYNMAPWNLSKRKITYKNSKILVNKEHELIFFHYSGFDSGDNEKVFNYYVPNKKDYIYKLRDEYIKEMNDNGQDIIGKEKWSYNYYNNGEPISKEIRKEYREKKLFESIETSPFDLSNEILQKMLNPNINCQTQDGFIKELIRKIIPFGIRKKIKVKRG